MRSVGTLRLLSNPILDEAANGTVAGRAGRSALAGQDDAAASGLGVQHRPDGWVAAEVIGEALEHGQVGAADELTVVGGDAVEGQLRSRMVPSASSSGS